MKIELKKIKVMESHSFETFCYSASLFLDGKRIGEVSNTGDGVPDQFDGDEAKYNEADAWLATLPSESIHGSNYHKSIEGFCYNEITFYLATQDLKKKMVGRILYKKAGTDHVLEKKYDGVNKIEDEHLDDFRFKNPYCVSLNILPIQKAVALYIG